MKKTYMGYSITIPGSDREFLAYKKSMKYIILTKKLVRWNILIVLWHI